MGIFQRHCLPSGLLRPKGQRHAPSRAGLCGHQACRAKGRMQAALPRSLGTPPESLNRTNLHPVLPFFPTASGTAVGVQLFLENFRVENLRSSLGSPSHPGSLGLPEMERSFSPLIVSFLVFTPGRSASPGCAVRKATARGRASVAIYVAEKFSSTPDLGGSPGSEKRSGSFKGPRERGRARVAQAAARTLASAPPPLRAHAYGEWPARRRRHRGRPGTQ